MASLSSTLQGQFVRYWSYNMNRFVWNPGWEWPGFGYTSQEKGQMVELGKGVGAWEFRLWAAVVSVLAIRGQRWPST